ncbi:MAG: hypothetical protein ABUL72_04925, partial [Armatimonadota bacterium]
VQTRILADGGKFVRLEMTLKQPDGKIVTIIQESSYRKDGRPLKKSQTTTVKGSAVDQVITVDFDEGGAAFTAKVGKQVLESKVPYPAGAPIMAAPEFWVIRDIPRTGLVVTYSRFDLAEHEWTETKCTYIGKRKIKVGKKTYNTHFMQMGDVATYLDDDGNPVRLESGSTVMERA